MFKRYRIIKNLIYSKENTNKYKAFYSCKYKNCNINYLDEKSFEKHLQDVKLKTYVIMEDDYNVCKYICFDNDLKQKLY